MVSKPTARQSWAAVDTVRLLGPVTQRHPAFILWGVLVPGLLSLLGCGAGLDTREMTSPPVSLVDGSMCHQALIAGLASRYPVWCPRALASSPSRLPPQAEPPILHGGKTPSHG